MSVRLGFTGTAVVGLLLTACAVDGRAGSDHGWSPYGYGRTYSNNSYGYGGYGGGYGSRGYDREDARFTPRPGVVCDRYRNVCYDRGGPDVGLTRDYFGGSAADRVRDWVGDHSRNDPYYRPGQGVKCDRGDEVCFKRGQPDWGETRKQFGRDAANDIRQRGVPKDKIVVNPRITCDRGDQECYKHGQPNVDATRTVFGKEAARDFRNEIVRDRQREQERNRDRRRDRNND